MSSASVIPWYEAVGSHERLSQGDFVFDCPILTWRKATEVGIQEDGVEWLHGQADAVEADVIVMTRACDLAQNRVHER